jgi:hypothetical protein
MIIDKSQTKICSLALPRESDSFLDSRRWRNRRASLDSTPLPLGDIMVFVIPLLILKLDNGSLAWRESADDELAIWAVSLFVECVMLDIVDNIVLAFYEKFHWSSVSKLGGKSVARNS